MMTTSGRPVLGWYLAFHIDSFGTFSIGAIRPLFSEAVCSLTQQRNRLATAVAGASSGPSSGLSVLSVEREMVYTLVRLCFIELEAGHTEHCIALFQARHD